MLLNVKEFGFYIVDSSEFLRQKQQDRQSKALKKKINLAIETGKW